MFPLGFSSDRQAQNAKPSRCSKRFDSSESSGMATRESSRPVGQRIPGLLGGVCMLGLFCEFAYGCYLQVLVAFLHFVSPALGLRIIRVCKEAPNENAPFSTCKSSQAFAILSAGRMRLALLPARCGQRCECGVLHVLESKSWRARGAVTD